MGVVGTVVFVVVVVVVFVVVVVAVGEVVVVVSSPLQPARKRLDIRTRAISPNKNLFNFLFPPHLIFVTVFNFSYASRRLTTSSMFISAFGIRTITIHFIVIYILIPWLHNITTLTASCQVLLVTSCGLFYLINAIKKDTERDFRVPYHFWVKPVFYRLFIKPAKGIRPWLGIFTDSMPFQFR